MPTKLKWKSDMEKNVVVVNFERRGFQKATPDDPDWNLYWANVNTIKVSARCVLVASDFLPKIVTLTLVHSPAHSPRTLPSHPPLTHLPPSHALNPTADLQPRYRISPG
jgi:hypothetical protein